MRKFTNMNDDMKSGKVKNVLLTGASGFIGRRMVSMLSKNKEYKLILLTSAPVSGHTYINHKNYTFTKEDFISEGITQIDIVIHLGAFSPSNREEMNQVKGNLDNINNTYTLLNSLPNNPERFIYCSSVCVYGDNLEENTNEHRITAPGTLYGTGKLFCERMVREWGKEHKVSVGIARFGSIYGVGENENKVFLIPDFIKKVINSEPITVFTDGSEKRTYLFVDDLCRYLYKYALEKENADTINLVSQHSVSVKQILAYITMVEKKEADVTYLNRKPQFGNESYDVSLLDKSMGICEISMEDGIRQTYRYWEDILMR